MRKLSPHPELTAIYSPSNIEFLIHCHVSPEPHPRFDAPAIQECFGQLISMGAIKKEGQVYRTTDLGKAWVEALCRVEVPRKVYIDQQGMVLNEA